ncbi:LOW QUALITY PROTEIN: vomeronasal type-1 receptor 4-like [Mustela nigripes]|uniref:Vomeronasal type-1 receptor n=1 Tax=Mustela putorius furo TaxID=9669 RepID=A0A8U0UYB8_MUSPF|nr:LOW QUALITY PROTEIN: vomeronasal type-1 receptor 4-like [Mustela putorius furo]XP_059239343.1 LOW QUALITY PROTEIN: vomeronasal type-1 receptor 4-like [Mustela nigripes]
MFLPTGAIFLIQTLVGILGNFSLLYLYLLLDFTGCKPKPTDLIVKNLTVGNILVLFSIGIYNTMSSFGWYHIVSDFGCKFFLYVRGVGRGVSIGTTCLLSVFQAIIISPRNSRWAALKGTAPKCMVPSVVPSVGWVLQILVNILSPLLMTVTLNNKNITNRKSLGCCSSIRLEKSRELLNVALLSFPDVVFLGLMLWASSFMVFHLYRHKQRVQHILRTTISSSPESTATKTVLLLLSTFVYFITLSSVFVVFWVFLIISATDLAVDVVIPLLSLGIEGV